jgi:uncharacterized membrane protein (UPF0127 family)
MMRIAVMAVAMVLAAAVSAAAQDVDNPITAAQPTLPTEPLAIKTASGKVWNFNVEIPSTARQQEVGEMFRTNIPATSGMLFVWTTPSDQAMWMENCPVPEDMVFIAADGTILAIAESTVPYSTKAISAGQPEAAVLELQGGITATDDISVGDKVIAKPFTGS